MFGFANFYTKLIKKANPDVFDPYSFCFWRSIVLILISILFLLIKRERILNVWFLNNRFWFLMRTAGNFAQLLLMILSMDYLRVSTIQSITSISPSLVLILSVLILKEKFYIRYVFGTFICIIGTLLIVNNDVVGVDDAKKIDNMDILIGSIYGLVSTVFLTFINFGA